MSIDEIREQIAEMISTNIEFWDEVLNDTTPGNYGCESWDAEVDFNDIFVDIPKRTFAIKQGSFSADLVMGASQGESSFNETYTKSFTATGKFDFTDSNNVTIEEIDININRHIYSEEDDN